MNILFLSMAIGGGHHRSAEAIEERVKEKYPDSRTLVLNTFEYLNPLVNKLIIGTYLWVLKHCPFLYKIFYNYIERNPAPSNTIQYFNERLSSGLLILIQDFKPDIIVCTHALAMQSVMTIKDKISIPVVAVITDFSVHMIWQQKRVDTFIVANEFVKYELMEIGIPEKIIHPIGIPVSKAFDIHHDKSSDKITILIMGGSLGLGHVEKIFKNLINASQDIRIIVACGKNNKLRNKLNHLAKNSNKEISILGYSKNIPLLMDESDFIITKPGGMTIIESIYKRLPIILMDPLPGHEERNHHFMMKNRIAISLYKDMDVFIKTIDGQGFVHKQLQEHMKDFEKPSASNDVVRILEKLIHH